jgi:hypothetical protein
MVVLRPELPKTDGASAAAVAAQSAPTSRAVVRPIRILAPFNPILTTGA